MTWKNRKHEVTFGNKTAMKNLLKRSKEFNNCFRFFLRTVSSFRMKRLNKQDIPNNSAEIRLFLVVRNESLRLPFFLKYYFDLGVDRIIAINNNSTDNTIQILKGHKNVHLFQTGESFVKKELWLDILLHRYGINHWCIVVDTDEILMYPRKEDVSLADLCHYLDQEGFNALQCLLLDMYSNRPIVSTKYREGENPLLVCPYFDARSHYKEKYNFPGCRSSQDFRYFGGMRSRVFGLNRLNLTKFPLFKLTPSMSLSRGAHKIQDAIISNVHGALFHFKFFDDFIDKTKEEIKRKEYWNKAIEYKLYMDVVKRKPDINLYCPDSVKFTNSQQLIDLGILKTSEKFNNFVEKTIL